MNRLAAVTGALRVAPIGRPLALALIGLALPLNRFAILGLASLDISDILLPVTITRLSVNCVG